MADAALDGWHAWNGRWRTPLYHQDGFLLLSEKRWRLAASNTRAIAARADGPHSRTARRPRSAYTVSGLAAGPIPGRLLNPRAGWVESGSVLEQLTDEARAAGMELRENARVDAAARARLARVVGIEIDSEGRVPRRHRPRCRGRVDACPHFRPGHGHVDDRSAGRSFQGRSTGRLAGAAISGVGRGHRPHRLVRLSRSRRWNVEDRTSCSRSTGAPRRAARRPSGGARPLPCVRRSHPAGAGDAPVVGSRFCLYCDTFDGNFWIDHDPARRGLVVAAGDSGHGFKFAPILGAVDRRRGRRAAQCLGDAVPLARARARLEGGGPGDRRYLISARQRLPRVGVRRVAIPHDRARHEHLLDPDRQGRRLLEGRSIGDGRRIEEDEVRDRAGGNTAAVLAVQPRRPGRTSSFGPPPAASATADRGRTGRALAETCRCFADGAGRCRRRSPPSPTAAGRTCGCPRPASTFRSRWRRRP